MYGFPCCTERVTNPSYDSEGNAYGKKGNESCIIPKGCTKCVINATETEKTSFTSKGRKTFKKTTQTSSKSKKTASETKKTESEPNSATV